MGWQSVRWTVCLRQNNQLVPCPGEWPWKFHLGILHSIRSWIKTMHSFLVKCLESVKMNVQSSWWSLAYLSIKSVWRLVAEAPSASMTEKGTLSSNKSSPARENQRDPKTVAFHGSSPTQPKWPKTVTGFARKECGSLAHHHPPSCLVSIEIDDAPKEAASQSFHALLGGHGVLQIQHVEPLGGSATRPMLKQCILRRVHTSANLHFQNSKMILTCQTMSD